MPSKLVGRHGQHSREERRQSRAERDAGSATNSRIKLTHLILVQSPFAWFAGKKSNPRINRSLVLSTELFIKVKLLLQKDLERLKFRTAKEYATTVFPAKCRLRNERGNSILLTRH